MDTDDTHTSVEDTTIIDDSTTEPGDEISLASLTNKYKSLKDRAAVATSKLNESSTLSGMDSISTIVAEAMHQIEKFTMNGRKPSTMSSIKSRALAIIDPNSKWAAKWLDSKSEAISEEKIKESTIGEIADRVIASISQQREDVISYMEYTVEVRDSLATNIAEYQTILDQATSILHTIVPDTRDEMDLKLLITRLNKSIIQSDNTISNKINPLIASARIAITEIDSQLPDIEHDLKYEGSLKVAQQSLADLIGMAKTVKHMTEQAGDAIRQDIYETTLESIEMVGDVMIDTERMKQVQIDEQRHMEKVHLAMKNTHDKINRNFEDISQIKLDYIQAKDDSSTVFAEYYSCITMQE